SVVPVAPADTSPFTQLLRDAEREADAFDEVFTSEGAVREPYETLLQVFEEGGPAEVSRLRGLIRRRITEQEVTFNILGTPEGSDRPWLLDPLPVMYSAREWATLSEGMSQRARFLSLIFEDIYGPQRLLRARIIPPELVFSHPDFARSCVGWVPRGGLQLRLYAVDLGRSPGGEHYVY